jgi:hypothetical protein
LWRFFLAEWDRGTFELDSDTAEEFVAIVPGQRLRGRVRLVRSADIDQRWGFSFEPG